jgi:predicted dehydrogenase
MAKTEPIRLGIVGLGRAGWGMHCPELAGKEHLFRIVAGCDPLRVRRDALAERTGCAVYADAADLVADPAVEMVDVASRSCDHYAHAMMALRAGKLVFLEKPMCSTYAEAKRLVATARRARGQLYVRHNRRNEPAFLHIREIMASGILGDVVEIKLTRVGYSRRDDWQTLTRFSGGQVLNWGPHIMDHALQFLDSPVKRLWSDLKRIAAVGDAEDHFKIVLVGRNGRVVDIEISGGAAVGLPEYVVWGTRGGLVGKGNELTLRYLDPQVKLPPRRPNPGDPNLAWGTPETLPWIEETLPVQPKKTWDIWEELYKAVRRGKRFPITLDEALEVMRILSAAKKGTAFEKKRGNRR